MAVGQTLFASLGGWTGTSPIAYAYEWLRCGTDGGTSSGSGCTAIAGATNSQYALSAADLGQRLRVRVTARNSLGTANAISNPTVQVQSTAPRPTPTPPTPDPALPPGAVQLPGGKVSIPVTSVSPPERLIAGEIDFVPNTVRSRQQPIVLRVRVVDTRGYAVRDALVFARSTPLLTTSSGEVRTGRDGWARLQLTPACGLPARRPERPVLDPGAQAVGSAARGRLEPEARPGRNGRLTVGPPEASGRRAPARSLRERSLRYPWIDAMIGISRIATMFAILIIGLIAGPAVSL